MCSDRHDHGQRATQLAQPCIYMSRVVRKPAFAYAKTKAQISFAVTAQSLYFQNSKFQASSHLLWLYSPVCVGPGQKPRRPVFSERGSYICAISCIYGTIKRYSQVSKNYKPKCQTLRIQTKSIRNRSRIGFNMIPTINVLVAIFDIMINDYTEI